MAVQCAWQPQSHHFYEVKELKKPQAHSRTAAILLDVLLKNANRTQS